MRAHSVRRVIRGPYISHDWGQNVGIDNPPVLVEGDHGGHVLQRGGGRRGHLLVRHSRPGQRDVQLLPGRKEGLTMG